MTWFSVCKRFRKFRYSFQSLFLHLLAMNIKCNTLSRIWQRIQCTMFKEKNTKLTRHFGIELFICEEKSLKDNLRVQKNFYMIVYMIFIRSFSVTSNMILNFLNPIRLSRVLLHIYSYKYLFYKCLLMTWNLTKLSIWQSNCHFRN